MGLLAVLLTGCTKYARVEQLQLGMNFAEVSRVVEKYTYRGQTENSMEYSCKLDVPSSASFNGRTLQPYILKFRDNRLEEITLDERALDRQATQYRYSFGYGYGYPYYWGGRGYWYP